MCGIVGYIGNKNSTSIIIDGLKKLEYRGYDSAGISVLNNGLLFCVKTEGKVSVLSEKVEDQKLAGTMGIGHTRWATHGIPNKTNSHPHFNTDKSIYVVHNGIIENYLPIRKKLISQGYEFISETDSEVLPHLIDSFIKKGMNIFNAVRYSLNEVEGTYGIAVLYKSEPGKIIVAKKGSPLILGIGENENFIASDTNAITPYTNRMVYFEDNEIAEVTKNNFTVKTISDEKIEKEIIEIKSEINKIDKIGYDYFMLKEIMEQPLTIENTFRGRILLGEGTSKLGGLTGVEERLCNSKRIILSACGTSWHSCLVGEYMLEQLAEIPTEVEYASELRYRNPIINKDDTFIFISQSGETADTLAAMEEVKRKDALVLGICNVVGSSIARKSDAGIYIHAGAEIGVASTKAFTSQIMTLALLALFIGRRRKVGLTDGMNIVQEIKILPKKIEKVLQLSEHIKRIAENFSEASNFLYLGRGYNFPVALEGALKLKEISYIHAEGYPAAEMKHGPIALIDENMPTVFLAPQDSVYEKILSNIQEIKARKGKVIAIADENDNKIDELVDWVIKIPSTIKILTPILSVIPLQLLAYFIAIKKGLNVDQPRNLAKSVTVE